jgi:hypothetical protein
MQCLHVPPRACCPWQLQRERLHTRLGWLRPLHPAWGQVLPKVRALGVVVLGQAFESMVGTVARSRLSGPVLLSCAGIAPPYASSAPRPSTAPRTGPSVAQGACVWAVVLWLAFDNEVVNVAAASAPGVSPPYSTVRAPPIGSGGAAPRVIPAPVNAGRAGSSVVERQRDEVLCGDCLPKCDCVDAR